MHLELDKTQLEFDQAPPEAGQAPPEAGQAPPEAGQAPPEASQAPVEASQAPPEAGQAPVEASRKKQGRKRAAEKPNKTAFYYLILMAGILILLTVVVALSFSGSGKKEEALNLNDMSFPIRSSEAGTYYTIGTEAVLRIDGGGISVLNIGGAELYRVNSIINTPVVSISGNNALIADFDGFNYFLLNAQAAVYQGRTEDPIKGLAVSQNGQAALLLERAETKGVLRVLDEKGALLFDWLALDRQNSGFILGACFTDHLNAISFSLLNTDSDVSFPIVQTLSLRPENLGERIDSINLSGMGPVTYLKDAQDGRLVMGSHNSVAMESSNHEVKAMSFYSISALEAADKAVYILASTAVNNDLGLYYWNGSTDSYTQIGDQVFSESAIILRGSQKYFAIAQGDKLYLYDKIGMMLARELTFSEELIGGMINERGDVLAITRARIRRVRW